MIARPNAVLSVLIKHFGSTFDGSLTREEIHLAGRLKTILEESYKFGVEVDSKEEAVLDIDGDDFQWNYDDEHLPPAKYDGVLDLDEITFGEFKVQLGKVKEAINFYRSAKTGRRSLDSMSNRFRFLKNEHHIRKLKQVEEDLKNGEIRMNRLDGLAKISQLLLEKVREKDEKGLGMHDIDLQQMALQVNDDGKFVKDFKASDTWLLNFKRAHNIGGRHVTKFVTMRNFVDYAIKKKDGEDFVEEIKQLVVSENIPPECVLNADQSGIQKHLVSKRTLTFLGSKRVDRVVDAVTATTHSFTVMPTISANGDLGEVLYVNLSEPNGLPKKGHYQASNLVVTARKSHMMTKDLAGVWLEKCVAPYVSNNKVLLVLDSWPAFKDVQFIKSKLPATTTVIVKTIPAGTTGFVQPLDVYFFQQFKKFIKYITNYAFLHEIPWKPQQRDSILKMISMVYRQFRCERFREYRKYSWFRAGYIDRPADFVTPPQYCTTFQGSSRCSAPNCVTFGCVKCAYCEKVICFHHFVIDPHVVC